MIEQVGSKDDYLRPVDLIRRDEIRLLVHNRYGGIRKSLIYAHGGTSFKYFEKAYETEKIILQLGEFGARIGAPVPWQEVLGDHGGQKEEIQWCKTCKDFRTVEEYEDGLWLSEKMIPDSNIPCRKSDGTQDVWIGHFNLPTGRRTLYPKGCPKWGKMEADLYTDTAAERMSDISSEDSGKVDKSFDNRIREFEGKIREYEDFLFGVKLFYDGTKLVQPSSALKAVSFEEHYKKVKRRGKRVLNKAKTVLSEAKTSGNSDRLKEVVFPPLEKEIMRATGYPDNMPRMRLLLEACNELFPERNREIPLTKEEHMLVMDKVIDKF